MGSARPFFLLSALFLCAGCGAVFINEGSKNYSLTEGLVNPAANPPKKLDVPRAQRIVNNFEEGGKSTSFNVLQFQRDLTAARSAEVKALADYNKALHQFYFREGSTLERNKITLELR